MKYTPELLKAADYCQHRSFITNRYTGKRIAVDCGQCDLADPENWMIYQGEIKPEWIIEIKEKGEVEELVRN